MSNQCNCCSGATCVFESSWYKSDRISDLERENERLKEALKYLTDLDMDQVHSLIRQKIKDNNNATS